MLRFFSILLLLLLMYPYMLCSCLPWAQGWSATTSLPAQDRVTVCIHSILPGPHLWGYIRYVVDSWTINPRLYKKYRRERSMYLKLVTPWMKFYMGSFSMILFYQKPNAEWQKVMWRKIVCNNYALPQWFYSWDNYTGGRFNKSNYKKNSLSLYRHV